MPDDLANKINEVLNNKPITPEDELADVLDEMARDIALIEPNPGDWGGCNKVKTSNEWRSFGLHQFSKFANRVCY